MRWQIILAAGSLAACLGASVPQAGKKDQDAIQGVWHIIGGEFQGKPMPADKIKSMDIYLTFDGNTVEHKGNVLALKRDPKTGEQFVLSTKETNQGTFKLDDTKKPKQFDLTTNKDGKTEIGLYELNGDELRICTGALGAARPNKFKTDADSGNTILIFERVKK